MTFFARVQLPDAGAELHKWKCPGERAAFLRKIKSTYPTAKVLLRERAPKKPIAAADQEWMNKVFG